MAYLTESRKRDFIKQLIAITENNAELIAAEGYYPAGKISVLKEKSGVADHAEARQQEVAALAKDTTKEAKRSLTDAYQEASNMVELLAGLLGKNHTLIQEIRKIRK